MSDKITGNTWSLVGFKVIDTLMIKLPKVILTIVHKRKNDIRDDV